MTRVLVVDNYDSFTYNLVQYLGELGAQVEAVRNDRAQVDELLAAGFDRVVVSPGPCTPNEAGISVEVMRRFPEQGTPTLGVCLGHQSLAQAFGGRVVQHLPVHGKTTTIEHDGRTIFAGLPSPLTVGRYHSLVVDPELPAVLERTAFGGDVVMGLRHRGLPAEGVQFHPESVLTEHGKALLGNFLGSAPAPEDVVRAWVQAFNEGDAERSGRLMVDDLVMVESTALPGAARVEGREALERYMAGWRRNWSWWRWTPEEIVASGDKVYMAAQLALRGRSSDADVSRRWVYVFTVRNGRIARQEGYDDEGVARAAAGLA
jgi:anthranilate synthase/aminodeoxychorismate synthase-like glutamine amidotransferase